MNFIQAIETITEIEKVQFSCRVDFKDKVKEIESNVNLYSDETHSLIQELTLLESDLGMLSKELSDKKERLKSEKIKIEQSCKKLECLKKEEIDIEKKFQGQQIEINEKIRRFEQEIEEEILKNIERRNELNRLQINAFEKKNLRKKK